MNQSKVIKTTLEQIINYWVIRIDESELSIDFSEANERCWRCAYKSKLDRCHIIPASLGGLDDPSNLVLLCRRCHVEAPNIKDKNFFWDWLKASKVSFYDTYWTIRGMQEYEFIYKETFEKSVLRLGIKQGDFDKFLEEKTDFFTIHFGEGRVNPSTIAGIFRSFIMSVSIDKT